MSISDVFVNCSILPFEHHPCTQVTKVVFCFFFWLVDQKTPMCLWSSLPSSGWSRFSCWRRREEDPPITHSTHFSTEIKPAKSDSAFVRRPPWALTSSDDTPHCAETARTTDVVVITRGTSWEDGSDFVDLRRRREPKMKRGKRALRRKKVKQKVRSSGVGLVGLRWKTWNSPLYFIEKRKKSSPWRRRKRKIGLVRNFIDSAKKKKAGTQSSFSTRLRLTNFCEWSIPSYVRWVALHDRRFEWKNSHQVSAREADQEKTPLPSWLGVLRPGKKRDRTGAAEDSGILLTSELE